MLDRSSIFGFVAAMNKLSTEERTRVVAALVEGNSLRAITRMTGMHRSAILKLLAELGAACSAYQDKVFRNLPCKRIQCDEIWSFVGAKEKNASAEKKEQGLGRCMDLGGLGRANRSSFLAGMSATRDGGAAYHFMHDLAGRLAHRVSLPRTDTSPICKPSRMPFGTNIDYAMLVKIYGEGPLRPKRGTVPRAMHGTRASQDQWPAPTSATFRPATSSGKTSRCGCRCAGSPVSPMGFPKRLRTTNTLWRLHFMQYNFCRIHQTLARHSSDGGWCFRPRLELGGSDRAARLPNRLKPPSSP